MQGIIVVTKLSIMMSSWLKNGKKNTNEEKKKEEINNIDQQTLSMCDVVKNQERVR